MLKSFVSTIGDHVVTMCSKRDTVPCNLTG